MSLQPGDLAVVMREFLSVITNAPGETDPINITGQLQKGDVCLIVAVKDYDRNKVRTKNALVFCRDTYGWVVEEWDREVDNRTHVRSGETNLTLL